MVALPTISKLPVIDWVRERVPLPLVQARLVLWATSPLAQVWVMMFLS